MNLSERLSRVACAWSLAFLLFAPAAQAENFNGISFTLNGSAQVVDNVIRLTETVNSQAGSAFMSGALMNTESTQFSLYFEFRIHGGTGDGNGTGGADGITVTLSGDAAGASALGGAGVGIGYSGISPSYAFEFDTWENFGIDVGPNAIGVNADGDVDSIFDTEPPFDLESGDTLYAWVDFDGPADVMTLWANDQPTRAGAFNMSLGTNFVAALGDTVYLGFTAGTGGLNANHDIERVEFVYGRLAELPAAATPVPVNQAWSLLILVIGIMAVSGWALRRRVTARA